ncbi:hypothetical protein C8F04DRAFT_1393277 [Mycena alexandri]|uniref:F-box domain-containing protein n=1 Tax=Mycena alexandri TaxID=1745969 RepID=A0AAD6T3R0_9AGAR|nr:hypothetical protein C8F04DRAFT_1393277 [Mycena alexandri]
MSSILGELANAGPAYPVSTLPVEIIREIFFAFVPVYPNCPPLIGLESPTLLTQICHDWRVIAHTTRALWRAIGLDFFSFDTAQILNAWLLRSHPLPLSMEIEPELIAPFQSLLPIILPHRARWEYVEMRPLTKHLAEIAGPMPLLRHLTLSLHARVDTANTIAFQQTPMLCAVDLNHFAARLILPFAQLTSLTLRDVYPHECVPVLRQTAYLTYCKLSMFVSNNVLQPPGSARDISLPLLESLIITNHGADPVTICFSNLIVPALRHLAIPEHSLMPQPINALSAFIQRSGCTLETVRITGNLDSGLQEGAYQLAFPGVGTFLFGGI